MALGDTCNSSRSVSADRYFDSDNCIFSEVVEGGYEHGWIKFFWLVRYLISFLCKIASNIRKCKLSIHDSYGILVAVLIEGMVV